MINKKGALVLRDIIFMMMIVSSIFIFAGLFVSETAFNYGNTNMSNEWSLTQTNTIANSTFYNTGTDVGEAGESLSDTETGIFSLITGTLDGIGNTLFMVLTAPNTIGGLLAGTLEDMGVTSSVTLIIKYLIVTILWGIVIFTVASAFLQGGKL